MIAMSVAETSSSGMWVLGSDMSPFAMRRLRAEGETTGLAETGILSKSLGPKTETELPVWRNASVIMPKPRQKYNGNSKFLPSFRYWGWVV